MSVLLQRPHHIPGLITLNKTHVPSPARQRQQLNRNTQPILNDRKRVSVPIQTHDSSPAAKQPQQPRRRQKSQQDPPATPVPAPRRRSPRAPTPPVTAAATPDALPEWDSPPKASPVKEVAPSTPVPSSKRTRRPPTADSPSHGPINWQQAALVPPKESPAAPRPPVTGSQSAPSSPVTRNPAPATTHYGTFPSTSSLPIGLGINNPSPTKRPSTHVRAPSYPTFPMHRQKDTFTSISAPAALENLFNLPQGHVRGASTSLGTGMLHARMAERERERQEKDRRRKDAFAAFAGASFQTAPNAITTGIPSIFGRLAALELDSSDDESDSSFDGGVIDLGDPNSSKDDLPAFLM